MFFDLARTFCRTVIQRTLECIFHPAAASPSPLGNENGVIQNHAPDSRPGHASQALKLLTEPVLEKGGFLIPEGFVNMVDKTGLQFFAAILL
jgi:hypothetical protein